MSKSTFDNLSRTLATLKWEIDQVSMRPVHVLWGVTKDRWYTGSENNDTSGFRITLRNGIDYPESGATD